MCVRAVCGTFVFDGPNATPEFSQPRRFWQRASLSLVKNNDQINRNSGGHSPTDTFGHFAVKRVGIIRHQGPKRRTDHYITRQHFRQQPQERTPLVPFSLRGEGRLRTNRQGHASELFLKHDGARRAAATSEERCEHPHGLVQGVFRLFSTIRGRGLWTV